MGMEPDGVSRLNRIGGLRLPWAGKGSAWRRRSDANMENPGGFSPPGFRYPDQNGMSSSSTVLPSSFWVCFARLRKSTVSAMISQP